MYGPVRHCVSAVSAGAPLGAGLVPVFTGKTVSIIWLLIVVLTALAVGTTVSALLPKEEK